MALLQDGMSQMIESSLPPMQGFPQSHRLRAGSGGAGSWPCSNLPPAQPALAIRAPRPYLQPMTSDDYIRIAYLLLLLIAVGGWFFSQGRESVGKTLQQAMIWSFLFLGLGAGYLLWNDITQRSRIGQFEQMASGEIRVPMAPDGHYYLTLEVNGVPVRFVADTGASDIVLTKEDARRAGIDPDRLRYTAIANTANGRVPTAPVRLREIRLGDLVLRDVRASVNGGEMEGSLLGMSYLRHFSDVSFRRGELVLTP